MTTPGADAFIRQLDQDPELLEQVRARILTRELLQLPETVAQLAAAQQEAAGRLHSLQTGQEQANSRLDDPTEAQQEATRRMDSLQAGQDRLQAGQDRLQAGQDSLQAGQGSLRTGLEQANRRLDDLTTSVQNLQGNMGNLTGTAYENRAARLAPRLLTRYLHMQRTQVLQAPNAETRPYLDDLVNQAVTDGRISDDEAQQLERADMIVTTTGDAQTAYVVIEASITVDDTDIDRAHQRALIMALIAGAPTRAAVIGQDISPANRQRADELGVTFMPFSQ